MAEQKRARLALEVDHADTSIAEPVGQTRQGSKRVRRDVL
jgi:hypothetical protein